MLHHTLSLVPRMLLKALDLFPKSNVLPDAILDLGDLERCVLTIFSVVFVTRVNFAGASFTRRYVKRAFQSVFLENLFFNHYEYHI